MNPIARRCALGAMAAAVVLAAGPGAHAAGKRYALLFAIDENHIEGGDLTKLSYAISDANKLAALLVAQGFETRVFPDAAAERSDVIRELNWYARKLDADDEFVLFYSGHGVRNPEINTQAYWMTYGAGISSLDASAIRLSHLMDYVREMKPRKKLVLLDHCFSGDVISVSASPPPAAPAPSGSPAPATPREVSLPPMHLEAKTAQIVRGEMEKQVGGEGIVVLAAARNYAYESNELKQGVFTKALLDALGSRVADKNPTDGKLSMMELTTYVSTFVSNFPPAGRQVPVESVQGLDLVNWIFAPNLPADPAQNVVAEVSARRLRYERTLNTWSQKKYITSSTLVLALSLLNRWKNAAEANANLPEADANLLAQLQISLDATTLPEDGRGRVVELLFNPGGE